MLQPHVLPQVPLHLPLERTQLTLEPLDVLRGRVLRNHVPLQIGVRLRLEKTPIAFVPFKDSPPGAPLQTLVQMLRVHVSP